MCGQIINILVELDELMNIGGPKGHHSIIIFEGRLKGINLLATNNWHEFKQFF